MPPQETLICSNSTLNSGKSCEICSKLRKICEICLSLTLFQWLCCWLLTSILPFSSFSIFDFEQVFVLFKFQLKRIFLRLITHPGLFHNVPQTLDDCGSSIMNYEIINCKITCLQLRKWVSGMKSTSLLSSKYREVKCDVLQGSMLGPPLLNIYYEICFLAQ